LRVRVKDILDLLAAGATREEILEDYLKARLHRRRAQRARWRQRSHARGNGPFTA